MKIIWHEYAISILLKSWVQFRITSMQLQEKDQSKISVGSNTLIIGFVDNVRKKGKQFLHILI